MSKRERDRRVEQSRRDRAQKAEKKYLRVKGLRERYGNVSEKTIDRWRRLKRIPRPDFYQGTIPYWSTGRLDECDEYAVKHNSWHPRARTQPE